MVWLPCDDCEEMICTVHGQHAFECDCPPIDEWGNKDPYEHDYPERSYGVS